MKILKYENRKFYKEGKYFTLKEVGNFILQGEDVTVICHKTKNDITAEVMNGVYRVIVEKKHFTKEQLVDMIRKEGR